MRLLWPRTLVPLIAVTAAVYSAPAGHAQSAVADFDAVSVKPSNGNLGIDLRYLPGRLAARALTLRQLICEAYGIESRELTGGPDWMNSDMFDVTATSSGDVNRDRMRLMLQAVLRDRFKVQIAKETRTGNVYTLTAPNATRQNINPPANTERSRLSTIRNENKAAALLSYTWEGQNTTMGELAKNLAANLRAPVTDQTGLTDNYDFTLNYSLDEPAGPFNPDPNFPTIVTAVQSQLGLKLVAGRGPVDVYVVQNAERPTPD